MRKLITGVDDRGRSCVVEDSEIELTEPEGGHGVRIASVYATAESPPPAREPGRGAWIDQMLAPGLLRASLVEHPPPEPAQGETTANTMHHKDTIDIVYVEEGSAELVLDDGRHGVGKGDVVVMPGVDHAWNAGAGGCRLFVVKIGTPAPDEG